MTNQISPRAIAETLPADLLAGIGDIVVRWGRLEYQLHRLICIGYALTNETGRALTIGMDIKVACGVLRTLTHGEHWIKHKELRGEIRKLSTEIQNNADHRHAYAHGAFGFDLESPNSFARYLFKSAEHRVLPSSEPVKLETLKELALQAQGFVDRAIELTVRLKAFLEKSS